MSPIQCPRYLSEASLAASSLEDRKTSRSVGIAVKRHFGTAGHWATVIVWTERPTLMKCSSARFRGWSGHVQASVKELNVASRAINRVTSLGALSLSSSKAIWQMILWPRSPHAQTDDADPMKAKETARQARRRNNLEYPKASSPHGNGVDFRRDCRPSGFRWSIGRCPYTRPREALGADFHDLSFLRLC